jgi:hypothetical protein
MKSTLITVMSLAFSVSAFALESGTYVNNSFKAEQAQLYKSVTIDTSKCEKGGAIVKFYGADAMNFCVGTATETVFKTTKCIGKELPYPFGGCVGVKKKVIMKQSKTVLTSRDGNAIALVEVNSTDDKVTFSQTYNLSEEGGDIRLNYSFKSETDGRTGKEVILFERAN